MSTKISFFMFFLSVIFDIGLYIAVEGMVLEEKMVGLKLLTACFYCTKTGSFTIKSFIISVVMSYGCP